jgi:PAS domain S-box-containing protein
MRLQVRRERDLFERIMETSPTAIILVDAEGEIIFANSIAEQLLRLSREEILSRAYDAPAWEVTDFAGNPQAAEQLAFSQVKATGRTVFGVETAIRWPDGGRALLLVNAAPSSLATMPEAGWRQSVCPRVHCARRTIRARAGSLR